MAQPRLLLPFSGAKLREARERAGLSRPDLAKKCAEHGRPVTLVHLGRLEGGNHRPSPGLLRTLVDALDAVMRERDPESGLKLDDLLDTEAAAS